MSQNPVQIPTTGTLSGLALATGINNAFDSLSRWLSGPTAPTAAGLGLSSLAGVVWHDTAANVLKVRDQADSAWITVGSFDEANKLFQAPAAREAITLVSANQTITAASHFANLVASAAVTLTLAQASTLSNGACAFSLSAQGGAVTLTPNAADSIVIGQTIQTAGIPYVLAQGGSAFVVCDGAGKWYLLFLSGPGVQPSTYRNLLINGGFDIWQRGTSFSTSGYTADRWSTNAASGAWTAVRGQDVGPVSNRPYGNYLLLTATSAVSGYLQQPIEDVRVGAGQTVTLSYYTTLVSGSDTGGIPTLTQNFGAGGSPAITVMASSDAMSGNRRVITFNIPVTSGKTIGVSSYLGVVIPFAGTFSKSYWGVQLEIGTTPTPFETLPVDVTLARCQRYFAKSYAQGVSPASNVGAQGGGITLLGATADINKSACVPLPVAMRATPSLMTYDNAGASGKISVYVAGTGWANGYNSVISSNSAYVTVLPSSAANCIGISCDFTANAEF